PSFRASELPSFRASELPSFRASELPSFRASELPSFRGGLCRYGPAGPARRGLWARRESLWRIAAKNGILQSAEMSVRSLARPDGEGTRVRETTRQGVDAEMPPLRRRIAHPSRKIGFFRCLCAHERKKIGAEKGYSRSAGGRREPAAGKKAICRCLLFDFFEFMCGFKIWRKAAAKRGMASELCTLVPRGGAPHLENVD
ncbi:hypothetical protein, partial [Kaistia sp. MMO-174]|uniref:hypothetical protein n=1 Tax=Kaistia sp. MMO-174 TaxID=3081256 RepID=UPI003017B9FC